MIASEKTHQNLSDYSQFLFKKRFEINEKQILFCEKIKNAGNFIHDYTHSFSGKDL